MAAAGGHRASALGAPNLFSRHYVKPSAYVFRFHHRRWPVGRRLIEFAPLIAHRWNAMGVNPPPIPRCLYWAAQ